MKILREKASGEKTEHSTLLSTQLQMGEKHLSVSFMLSQHIRESCWALIWKLLTTTSVSHIIQREAPTCPPIPARVEPIPSSHLPGRLCFSSNSNQKHDGCPYPPCLVTLSLLELKLPHGRSKRSLTNGTFSVCSGQKISSWRELLNLTELMELNHFYCQLTTDPSSLSLFEAGKF